VTQTSHPLHGAVHHYGYVVADLEEAVAQASARLGAGPFFLMENVPLQDVTSRGEPAVFDHSSAFGQFGSVPIELMEIHRCEPDRVRDGFALPAPQLHHVAWAVPELDAAIARLEAQGIHGLLRAGLGDIQFLYSDATQTLGHHVELHDDNAAFRGFFAMIQEASVGWDGSDPLRRPEPAGA
jgi:catechol 2,3-dioxygenase-like lactoylglutathione lyase family enzyme